MAPPDSLDAGSAQTLPGESQGRWSLVGCRLWGRTGPGQLQGASGDPTPEWVEVMMLMGLVLPWGSRAPAIQAKLVVTAGQPSWENPLEVHGGGPPLACPQP